MSELILEKKPLLLLPEQGFPNKRTMTNFYGYLQDKINVRNVY
jgi:hypothetical protein